MIVSTTRQFIFLHNPKAGGTSIKRALRPYIQKWELEKVPQNILCGNGAPCKHDSFVKLHRKINKKVWNSCFKFAFVRNPWSWMVSIYEYSKKYHKDPKRKMAISSTFEEFTRWLLVQSPQSYIVVGGQLQFVRSKNMKVDFVGKVETIQKDFNFVCRKLNIGTKKIKKHNGTNHIDYRKYYSQSSLIDFVAAHYKDDIRAFNYTFEG